MRIWLKKWWPVSKVVFTVAILVFVGRQFLRDLQRVDLGNRSLDPVWLTLSGVLYLAGIGLSAVFWIRLLRLLGQHPQPLGAARAYYIGHLGKYIPGKAWALLLRATLARSSGVGAGVAGITAFYEVLTTMASGALLAAVLFWLPGPGAATSLERWDLWRLLTMQDLEGVVLDRRVFALLALALLVVVGLPIVPWVFNRLVYRLSLPFQEAGHFLLPRLRWGALGEGLVLTAGGWFLLGASLWAVLRGIAGQTPPLTWDSWGKLTAFLSLSYVLGFVIILVPNGLGVREYVLTVCLAPDLAAVFGWTEGEARGTAVLAVLLLRLVWTAAELFLAAIIYWLPNKESSR